MMKEEHLDQYYAALDATRWMLTAFGVEFKFKHIGLNPTIKFKDGLLTIKTAEMKGQLVFSLEFEFDFCKMTKNGVEPAKLPYIAYKASQADSTFDIISV